MENPSSLGAKIIIVVNAEWCFLSYRLSLAKALAREGADVIVASGVERNGQKLISEAGFRFAELVASRTSHNPVVDLLLLRQLIALYRRERPDLVFHVTFRPVLWGSVAANLTRVPRVINLLPGLGFAFGDPRQKRSLKGRLIRAIQLVGYRVAFLSRKVEGICQNRDDFTLLLRNRVIRPGRTHLIRGSGVNVDRFAASPMPKGVPIVMLAARLLWNKGVGEFVEAARALRDLRIPARFALVGAPDDLHPTSVPLSKLREWHDEGVVEWWGRREDMPEVLRQASIVVLPSSYGEGVPKILLEACSCGRPVIAYDTPGCREIVIDGDNGLLVPPKDVSGLVAAIQRLIQDRQMARQMGHRGRLRVVGEFSERVVIAETLGVVRAALASPHPACPQERDSEMIHRSQRSTNV